MKNLKITTALLLFALAVASCKKNDNEKFQSISDSKEFIQQKGPKVQRIKINTTIDNEVKLAGGTTIKFRKNCFTKNGEPISGDVIIEAYEILNRKDVLMSGTNTNHSSGAPLISQGFIFIDAKTNGQSVDRNLKEPVTITMAANGDSYTQIWEGIIDDNGQFAWNGIPRANGNANDFFVKASASDSFIFDFGKLGWINCDVFYSNTSPKTTVKVTVANNPGSMASFMAANGETFVYFCAKGENVAAQLYTPDGPSAVKSYNDSMPIGALGKFISFSIKNGKFYYAEQETTITANLDLTLTLTETTEAAIQSAIDNLNNY
ncbi:hypothetical protein Pedsa_0427 [Pseudopedobacter saltans DSM 12145]|uniref:Uncharacterized protein n=1 Tax=Pseudopedobacter saltans (strain ATCC 51119 / DSM 12145 / JCM 21818 / CCUG 39354 / LMG 10337 / NBRC 100064 / NCIMB 13643) TaxID=762903 RepID=F0S5T8_PSESL|nr:hypothetical protein [Pseudopedobacter saltans]ADY51009.1 hypothetical protein Pedsa_0427 [Pseudopedobacter saltans DSM 12145]